MGQESTKRIIISGGYYATNIGNAFYELGAKYVLEKCLGDQAQIIMSSNKLGIFWSDLIPKADTIDYTQYYQTSYLVVLGPMMSPEYLNMWDDTFKRLEENGTRIVFMSAGANRYDKKEYDEVARILEKHKLHALITRDSETYNNYKDFFEKSYDGICCALYCNEYAPKYSMGAAPYVVMNFDNCREPDIVRDVNGPLEINNNRFRIKKRSFCSVSMVPEELDGGEQIIRTIHTVMPESRMRRTRGKNYYLSDVPYDYLNLYANADAVLTNRVHAAVTSVAYGTPVYLTNDTPRGNILKRIGCESVYEQVYKADPNLITSEKKKYEQNIRETFR